MRFSLVMATIHRDIEIADFVRSLRAQAWGDIELIVVDQNSDDRVSTALEGVDPDWRTVHLKSAPGLSRARNIGLREVTGDIVSFPDDDCQYPGGLLRAVASFLASHGTCMGLLLPVRTLDGTMVRHMSQRSGVVTRANVWRRATSVGLFLSRTLVENVGPFDQTLGLGAGTPWGGAEDIDYPLRALALGFDLWYETALHVLHPSTDGRGWDGSAARAYSYGAGWGRVCKKHGLHWFAVYGLGRALAGALVGTALGDPSRAKWYLNSFRGRARGWLENERL